MTRNTGLRMALLAGAALSQLAVPSHAAAQERSPATDAAAEIEEVVVTGSQIRGVAPVGSALIGLTREDLSRVPAINTTELLRQIPQISALGPDDAGGRGSIQGAQQNRTRGSSVNLRGIGPNATLLLVNGHRMAPAGYNGTFSDPTVIATDAIERIEIVADGASAIYGSDAIAGVVNLILRRNYDGIRTTVQYGGADGFAQSRESLVAGYSWDSGSTVLTFEHNLRTSLSANDRSFYTSDLRPFGGPDRRSQSSVPGNVSVAGTNYAIPNQDGRNLTAAQLAAGRGIINRFDSAARGEVFPRQERNNFTFSVNQRLTDKLKLVLDGFWFQRDWTQRFVPAGTITVSSNPSAANYSQFFVSPTPGVTTGSVNYNFFNDVGLVSRGGIARQYQGNAALELELPKAWRAVLGVTYSKTFEQETFDNFFSTYSGYVNPLLRDPNPATALNLFGIGGNNPTTLAKLFAEDGRGYTNGRLADINLQADGALFALPAGEVKVAVGISHRREAQSLVQSSSNNPTLTPQTTVNIHGWRYVDAVFAEAFVPLVAKDANVPLVGQLDVSLAVRSEKYSDFGRATNPKIGVNWRPVDDVQVHASYGKSFRAPALNFKNPTGTLLPPIQQIPDPTSPTGTTPGLINTGGNPNIGPERARTYSLGVDYQPSFVPGFAASINFFDVLYTDKIGQAGGGAGTVALTQEAYYKAYIERNPSLQRVLEVLANAPTVPPGSIDPTAVKVIVDGRANNIGKAKIQGLDFNFTYRFTAGPVNFELGEVGTYFTKYDNANTLASPYVDVVNTINWPTRWRSQTRATARVGDVTATGFLNYTPSYRNNTVTPVERVKAATTVDAQLSYDTGSSRPYWSRDITISLNVTNLFDTDPPYVNNTNGVAYDPQQASPTGRVVTVQLAKKW